MQEAFTKAVVVDGILEAVVEGMQVVASVVAVWIHLVEEEDGELQEGDLIEVKEDLVDLEEVAEGMNGIHVIDTMVDVMVLTWRGMIEVALIDMWMTETERGMIIEVIGIEAEAIAEAQAEAGYENIAEAAAIAAAVAAAGALTDTVTGIIATRAVHLIDLWVTHP